MTREGVFLHVFALVFEHLFSAWDVAQSRMIKRAPDLPEFPNTPVGNVKERL